MRSSVFDKAFLTLGSLAAGAGVSSALASITLVAVPELLPIVGAVIGLTATAFSGAFKERALTIQTAGAEEETSGPMVS